MIIPFLTKWKAHKYQLVPSFGDKNTAVPFAHVLRLKSEKNRKHS